MFRSAAEELSRWAEQCRRWSLGARTTEQRLTLQSWELFLLQAATEPEQDQAYAANPRRPITRFPDLIACDP